VFSSGFVSLERCFLYWWYAIVVYIPPVVDSFFREHDNWILVLQNGKAEMSFFYYCWKWLSLDFWVCQRQSLKDHCCKTQCMAFLGWTTGTHFKKQAATPVLYRVSLGYIWARATSHFWLQRSLGVFPRVVVAICQLFNFPLESPTPSRIAILSIEQDVLCPCLHLRHTKHSEFALVKHSLCLNLFLPLYATMLITTLELVAVGELLISMHKSGFPFLEHCWAPPPD